MRFVWKRWHSAKVKCDNVDKGSRWRQLWKKFVSPANSLSEVSVGDRIESYIVRIPKTVKDLNLFIYGKIYLIDATVIVFMRFLANFIMIVLIKIFVVCFKHKLQVKKNF